MEPMLMASLISGGSNVLGSAIKPAPNNQQSSAAQSLDQKFDFGGWTVATGGGDAAGGLVLPPWLILGAAFLAAWAFVKVKK